MSVASRRTWHTHHVGHLHLTVSAEPDDGDFRLDCHRVAAATTRELIELLESCRLAATWAVADPVHSAVSGYVALSELPHELAVLGGKDWLGPAVGRKVFARELGRRFTLARAAGLQVSTLISRTRPPTDHADLLVKHAIRAVAGLESAPIHNPFTEPRTLHYGVWEFSPAAGLPAPSTWLSSGTRRVCRCIRRAATQAATFHLIIDAAAIQPASAEMQAIGQLMRLISELSSRGLVEIETLGAAAGRLSDLPSVTPQRSILRMAA